jgi:hypothetical protein
MSASVPAPFPDIPLRQAILIHPQQGDFAARMLLRHYRTRHEILPEILADQGILRVAMTFNLVRSGRLIQS